MPKASRPASNRSFRGIGAWGIVIVLVFGLAAASWMALSDRSDDADTVAIQNTNQSIPTIKIADGAELAYTLRVPTSAGPHPAAILLHGVGQDRRDWDSFGTVLQDHGLVVIQIDQRGFGDSRLSAADRSSGNWIDHLPSDVGPVIDFLLKRSDVQSDQIWVVGNGLGGSVGFNAAQQDARIHGLVILSPTQTIFSAVMNPRTPATVLAIGTAAEQTDLQEMLDASAAPKQQMTIDDSGSNMEVLQKPEVSDAVLDWLTK